jgi:hypothetical protein
MHFVLDVHPARKIQARTIGQPGLQFTLQTEDNRIWNEDLFSGQATLGPQVQRFLQVLGARPGQYWVTGYFEIQNRSSWRHPLTGAVFHAKGGISYPRKSEEMRSISAERR